MGHGFKMQELVSPFQDLSVGEPQSPDKPDLEAKEAMKPNVTQGFQNDLMLIWDFFLYHSNFLTVLHHSTHPAPIPTKTGGESKSEEIQALKEPSWTMMDLV